MHVTLGAQYRIERSIDQAVSVANDGWTRIGSYCPFRYDYSKSFHREAYRDGEGGAVLTNNNEIYGDLLLFRSWHYQEGQTTYFTNPDAFRQGDWYYEMQSLGYNYRMTDIQAALGCSQLTKIEWFVKDKTRDSLSLQQCLSGQSMRYSTEREHYRSSFRLCNSIKRPFGRHASHYLLKIKEEGTWSPGALYSCLSPTTFRMTLDTRLCPIAEEISMAVRLVSRSFRR